MGDVSGKLASDTGQVGGGPHVDPLAARARCRNEPPRPRQVGSGPPPVASRVERVRAVTAIPGESGRERLADWRRTRRAVHMRDLFPVDGVVERPSDAHIVERRPVRVERNELDVERRLLVQLSRSSDLELA